MKTIDRFVLKSYFGPMILTFFIVMFVLMMNFMWRYIDELVGKGLAMGVIAELMMYAAINMISMGLPLATLLASIMTMGDLGENYELLAMKSCGMSLMRILRPLLLVVGMIAIGSFFIANNLVPYANTKMSALIYDIRQQKQTIEFQDGLFFNGIPDLSIRINKQHPDTKLLTGVLIYDYRNTNGNMSTIVADSGYISLSDDKRYLNVTLYNGERFEETRNYQWHDNNQLQRQYFDEQNMMIATSGFDFERSDASLFGNSGQSKNIQDLETGIDSLTFILDKTNEESFKPFFNTLFVNDNDLMIDSLRGRKDIEERRSMVGFEDSVKRMDVRKRQRLWSSALSNARMSRNSFSFEEEISKETLNQLYRYKAEWHRKLSLPVSIMIFFLIGAALGAIIRKGGLGMPIVVSVVFFVIYYIISITGEKMAREGTWSSFSGMWLSTFILLPLAVFLIYKANNDSNLFNAEWYMIRAKRIKDFFKRLWNEIKRMKNDSRTKAGA